MRSRHRSDDDSESESSSSSSSDSSSQSDSSSRRKKSRKHKARKSKRKKRRKHREVSHGLAFIELAILSFIFQSRAGHEIRAAVEIRLRRRPAHQRRLRHRSRPGPLIFLRRLVSRLTPMATGGGLPYILQLSTAGWARQRYLHRGICMVGTESRAKCALRPICRCMLPHPRARAQARACHLAQSPGPAPGNLKSSRPCPGCAGATKVRSSSSSRVRSRWTGGVTRIVRLTNPTGVFSGF